MRCAGAYSNDCALCIVETIIVIVYVYLTADSPKVNDTATGDPLFTVPLNVPDKSNITEVGDGDPINLCFEIHGQADAHFNLVSDACVSVNARYAQVRPDENINIIDRIYVRASDANRSCKNIEVSLDGCSASVDGVNVDNYMAEEISVRRYRNRVRIAVPNCQDMELVMWVFCLNNTFWSRASTEENEITFEAEMLRFVIARGLDLAERSHGILGMFSGRPVGFVCDHNSPCQTSTGNCMQTSTHTHKQHNTTQHTHTHTHRLLPQASSGMFLCK